jgi:proline iminopeptidase
MKKWIRVIGIIGAVLLCIVVVFLGISYRVYYSSPAAELPCRHCTGQARTVHVNGFDLYYEEIGTNADTPPLVIVHGGPGMSSQTFKHSFDFLVDEYRVIYYDQRGSGYSEIKPDPEYYTIEQLVEELEGVRREVLEDDRMILVGHSAGGALVQRYALKYGDHVEKMVLMASVPANGGSKVSGVGMDAVLAAMNVLAGTVPSGTPEEADVWFAQVTYESALARLYDPDQTHLLVDAGYVSYVTNREVTRSTMGGDYEPQLAELKVSTLLVYGVADSAYTGEAVMRQLHSVLPNSTLVRFDKSGHWPFLEEPEKFREVMMDFLESEW